MFSWTEYKPHKQGIQTVLSPLESEVMEIMWKEKRATARTVYTRLKGKRTIRRSTVNAAMSSLSKRGLLSAKIGKGRGGLRYVYRVKISRSRFERQVVGRVIASLLESYPKTTEKLLREKAKGG